MNKYWHKLLAGLLALVMIMALTGFTLHDDAPDDAGPEAPEEAVSAEVRPDLDPEELEGLDLLGEETEDGIHVKLTNASELDIIAINIRPSEGGDWSDNILAEEDVFGEEEASVLCVEPGVYDLQITFDGWLVGVLHQMDVNDITEAELHRQWNGLPYLVYTSVATGEEVDTSGFEQSTAEAEIAAGTWEYGGTSSSTGSGSSNSGGGWSGGGNSGGGDTGCLEGGGLFW